jgi:sugar lactone lactonase YvrE
MPSPRLAHHAVLSLTLAALLTSCAGTPAAPAPQPPKGVASLAIFAGNGQPGYGEGAGADAQFKRPSDIGIDGAGRLYVCDEGNNAVRRISPEGQVETLAALKDFNAVLTQPVDSNDLNLFSLAVATDGTVYVSGSSYKQLTARIWKIAPDGELSVFASGRYLISGLPTAADHWGMAQDLTLDAAGMLWMVDSALEKPPGETPGLSVRLRGLLRKFSPDGRPTVVAADDAALLPDLKAVPFTGLGDVNSFGIDAKQVIYLAQHSDSRSVYGADGIRVFDAAAGQARVLFDSADLGKKPGYEAKGNIAVTASGDLYFNYFERGLYKLTPAGEATLLVDAQTPPLFGVTTVEAMAIDESRQAVYVLDRYNHRVVKVQQP